MDKKQVEYLIKSFRDARNKDFNPVLLDIDISGRVNMDKAFNSLKEILDKKNYLADDNFKQNFLSFFAYIYSLDSFREPKDRSTVADKKLVKRVLDL